MTERLLRDCVTCGGQRPFEAPTCLDGHGADCPELACVECGEAMLAGYLQVDSAAAEVAMPPAAYAA